LILPLLTALLLSPLCSFAYELPPPEKFHNGLSLQGFTGILNAPSAHVTEEGCFYGLYTNQKESKWRDKVPFQDNYFFSVGFFNFAEVGGRLFDAPGIGRDLSANVKLTTEPFFRKYPYVPALAVGFQDIGGGASFFSSKYAVISEDIWRLRLSAGYAGDGSGIYATKGKFAGAEFKAHDWVYLLSDYDTRETNVGIRVVTPQFWRIPFSFTATAKSSVSHKPGNIDVAVGFNLPLDFKVRKTSKSETAADSPAASDFVQTEPATTVAEPKPAAPAAQATPAVQESAPRKLELLRDRLVQAGFTNVRVGSTNSGILVVEYENVRFNHNELDGVGVVLGLATGVAEEKFDSIRLVIKRHDISMVRLTMPLRTIGGFLNGTIRQENLNNSLVVGFDVFDEDVHFIGGKTNSGFLKSSLMLYPGLNTFVGTDFGVFDYELSLKPDLLVDIWKGAVVNARWDVPVAWSDNLDDNKPYRNSRKPTRVERLMLFQAFKPAADLMINLGAGLVLPHANGTLNEATWSPGNGTHRFRVLQAYAKDTEAQKPTRAYLGSYRYYLSPLDLYLEGTGGRFWAQDVGYMLELKRFFGDAAVSVFYKNSQRTDDRKWAAAGIQFSFPLTFGKDMKHFYGMQVRGTDEWSYAQQTTLTDSSHPLNDLPTYPLAINPQPVTALYRAYYNRDRLSEDYIRQHLDRLRDAWLRYGKDM
jgi:hypothetical protein